MATVPATVTLHLGVIDVPYTNNTAQAAKIISGARAKKTAKALLTQKAKKARKTKAKKGGRAITTGEVADILEKKYGVMEVFFEAHEDEISEALTDSVDKAIETLKLGDGAVVLNFKTAEAKIEAMFKQFLESEEIEQMGIEGVPTKAAIRGISHRKAHPYKKGNDRRPSFIDTGTYQQNFKAWVD